MTRKYSEPYITTQKIAKSLARAVDFGPVYTDVVKFPDSPRAQWARQFESKAKEGVTG